MRYLFGVKRYSVIRLPDTRADRLKPMLLAFIGVTCFGLGLAVSRYYTGNARASYRSRPQITGKSVPGAAAEAPLPSHAKVLPAGNVSGRQPTVEAVTNRVAPTNKLEVGRVAYLRCDGLSQPGGAFPCPRDPALERATWQILQQIASCAIADPGKGYADIRLAFRRGKSTSLRVFLPASQRPVLKRKAVYECVGKQLTSLTTGLDPLLMVVSFQFWIRPG
jgi:hypothetical protein